MLVQNSSASIELFPWFGESVLASGNTFFECGKGVEGDRRSEKSRASDWALVRCTLYK